MVTHLVTRWHEDRYWSLIKAHKRIEGPCAALPGAAAAKHAIAMLGGPHLHGEIPVPQTQQQLVDTVVSEGELHRLFGIPIEQHKLDLAAAAAIEHGLT
jgi:hypothetical protein